jgi:hypothetical protein
MYAMFSQMAPKFLQKPRQERKKPASNGPAGVQSQNPGYRRRRT